jgi:CRP-like cAMP-binding protein
VQFLLDGRVTEAGGSDIVAPAALGFEQLLEGTVMPATIVAAERSVTLSLTAEEFLALLSENVELAEGIFRMLIAEKSLDKGHRVLAGDLPADVKAATTALRQIDRLMLLQSNPLLAHATAAQLWRLSAMARELKFADGAEVLAGNSEAAILIVLSGALRVEGGANPETADTGDVVGLYETLAGSRFESKVVAGAPTQLLRIDRGALFELLADHTDLLQGVFSMLLQSTYADAADGRSGRTTSNTVSTP